MRVQRTELGCDVSAYHSPDCLVPSKVDFSQEEREVLSAFRVVERSKKRLERKAQEAESAGVLNALSAAADGLVCIYLLGVDE